MYGWILLVHIASIFDILGNFLTHFLAENELKRSMPLSCVCVQYGTRVNSCQGSLR